MSSERGLVARWRARVDGRRALLVVLAGVLPWVVVTWDTGWYPVFSLGFGSVDPLGFQLLTTYLATAYVSPTFATLATAALLYVLALVSALAGDPDARVTAGLLVLAGFSVASFAWGLSKQQGILAVPLGAFWLWGAVAVGYRDTVFWRAN